MYQVMAAPGNKWINECRKIMPIIDTAFGLKLDTCEITVFLVFLLSKDGLDIISMSQFESYQEIPIRGDGHVLSLCGGAWKKPAISILLGIIGITCHSNYHPIGARSGPGRVLRPNNWWSGLDIKTPSFVGSFLKALDIIYPFNGAIKQEFVSITCDREESIENGSLYAWCVHLVVECC